MSQSKTILIAFSVEIFVRYYREVAPGENFDFQVLNDLLVCLLKKCLLQEVFQMLNVTAQINTLVSGLEILLKSLTKSLHLGVDWCLFFFFFFFKEYYSTSCDIFIWYSVLGKKKNHKFLFE